LRSSHFYASAWFLAIILCNNIVFIITTIIIIITKAGKKARKRHRLAFGLLAPNTQIFAPGVRYGNATKYGCLMSANSSVDVGHQNTSRRILF
jgi:hypothetical protein